jgi:hypothetical protein
MPASRRINKQSDEALAMEFLIGTVKNIGGIVSFDYLTPGSEREKAAQQALVRVLRKAHPLSNSIRWTIAALLDPSHQRENRKLVIQLRRKGKQPQHARDLHIAIDIAADRASKMKMESAVMNAMGRYGARRATVLRAWEKHRSSPLVRALPPS